MLGVRCLATFLPKHHNHRYLSNDLGSEQLNTVDGFSAAGITKGVNETIIGSCGHNDIQFNDT